METRCGRNGRHAVVPGRRIDMWCDGWPGFGGGKDIMGLLARSSKVQSGVPAPVEGLGDIRSVTAGNSHVGAVDTSDVLLCWGDDRYGELGRGRFTLRDEAKRVAF